MDSRLTHKYCYIYVYVICGILGKVTKLCAYSYVYGFRYIWYEKEGLNMMAQYPSSCFRINDFCYSDVLDYLYRGCF